MLSLETEENLELVAEREVGRGRRRLKESSKGEGEISTLWREIRNEVSFSAAISSGNDSEPAHRSRMER